jgi:hypothetical protein
MALMPLAEPDVTLISGADELLDSAFSPDKPKL